MVWLLLLHAGVGKRVGVQAAVGLPLCLFLAGCSWLLLELLSVHWAYCRIHTSLSKQFTLQVLLRPCAGAHRGLYLPMQGSCVRQREPLLHVTTMYVQ